MFELVARIGFPYIFGTSVLMNLLGQKFARSVFRKVWEKVQGIVLFGSRTWSTKLGAPNICSGTFQIRPDFHFWQPLARQHDSGTNESLRITGNGENRKTISRLQRQLPQNQSPLIYWKRSKGWFVFTTKSEAFAFGLFITELRGPVQSF